jgi:hypothetical protein
LPTHCAEPQVALSRRGYAVVAWSHVKERRVEGLKGPETEVRGTVEAAIRRSGARWGTAKDLSGSELGADRGPQVAIDAAGRAVAVWTAGQGAIQTVSRGQAGRWSRPIDLESEAEGQVSVALDPQGDAIAAWLAMDHSVHAASRPVGGDWTTPATIPRAVMGNSLEEEPHVALDGRGDALAVWSQVVPLEGQVRETNITTVQVAARPRGAPWGGPADLRAPSTTVESTSGLWPPGLEPFELGPSSDGLAENARGDAVALWTGEAAGHEITAGATQAAGGSWTGATTISRTAEIAADPSVGIDDQGEAIAL